MNTILPSAILFIDLQEGLVETSRTQTFVELRRAASVLSAIAGILGIPCHSSIIQVGPDTVPPLISELARAEKPVAPRLRRTISAVDVIDPGARDVLLAGIALEGAVLHTALAARSRDMQVLVAIDACGGISRRTEEAAIRQMEAAGVVTTSVASLATGWFDTAAVEQKAQMMRELQRLLM